MISMYARANARAARWGGWRSGATTAAMADEPAGAAPLTRLNLLVGLILLALAAGVGYLQTIHCARSLATVREHIQRRRLAREQLEVALQVLPMAAAAGGPTLVAGLHRVDDAVRGYDEAVDTNGDWPPLRARIVGTEAQLRQGVATVTQAAALGALLQGHSGREAEYDAHLLRSVHNSHQVRNLIEIALYAAALATTALIGREARRRECARQAELRARLDRLEEGTRELRAFAGRVAHDLRGPLTPILVSSKMIEEAPVTDPVRQMAERIERSAGRLRDMIDLLLRFARLERPATPSLRTDVALVATQVLDDVRERALALGATIETRLSPGVQVSCEPEIVASALYNLIDNALKYGLDGSRNRIDVTVDTGPGVAVITVEDHGPGVPEDEVSRIFDPLFRGARASSEDGGIGLGLATVKRLVEARAGRVRVARASHGGARFIVELPAAV
jgi:signal transduction histidine kinase